MADRGLEEKAHPPPAILLTGYLGGATATHVRIGEPFFFPVVFGVLLWASLYVRDGRARALLDPRPRE